MDDDGHHGQDIERLRLRWVIELIMTEEDASNMTPSDNHNNNIDGSISFSLWTDRPGKDPVNTL